MSTIRLIMFRLTAPMPDGFYDRERELSEIAQVLGSGRAELVLVYGRRGVGKSRLLDEAIGSGDVIYASASTRMTQARRKNASASTYPLSYRYTAVDRVMPLQLEDMVLALHMVAPAVTVMGTVRRFEDFLDLLGRVSDQQPHRPFSVVLDEFPYLARAERGVLTVLQRWWNQNKGRRRDLKLFLAGSNVSFMEREALADDAALRSVRTGNLEILPLTYRHAASFYPHLDPRERVAAWTVWGGLPATLEEVQRGVGLWENIEQTTLRRGARLYREPEWLQYTELRAEAIYSSIVRAVASGRRTPSDIAAAVGRKSASEVTPYLARLLEARMLVRKASMTAAGERERTAQYLVAEPFHAFWYRFVDPYRALIDLSNPRPALDALRDPARGLDKLISEHSFEDVCRTFLLEAVGDGRLPSELRFDRVGSWWLATRDISDEVDIVAFAAGRLAALGECKWTNEPVGMEVLAKLDRVVRSASHELRPGPSVYRLLFSRSGFERDVRKKAADPHEKILLFEPRDLYR